MQHHSVTSLETAHSLANGPWLMEGEGGWGRSMYSEFPGNCSVSYLSFVYGKSLWAELNGGENYLHWKANMLPLFSIMTLWNLAKANCTENHVFISCDKVVLGLESKATVSIKSWIKRDFTKLSYHIWLISLNQQIVIQFLLALKTRKEHLNNRKSCCYWRQ